MLASDIAVVRGERVAAAEGYREAALAYDELHMLAHAATARRRRGEIVGGVEGAELLRASDAWMLAQGVRVPARFACLLSPVAAALAASPRAP